MTDSIVIKGINQGVLAALPNGRGWADVTAELVKLIEQRGAFFKGAQLVLDMSTHQITPDDLLILSDRLQTYDVHLVGVLSEEATVRAAAEELGLATDLADIPPPVVPSRPTAAEGALDEEIDSEEYGTVGVLIKRTLRNGRTVRSSGHVVVIGDVNYGAQIIAVGDIIVWGKLRGVVHAGAKGDESAVVCALDLAPTQLRIASLISVPPQEHRKNPRPEMAHISGGRIEAVPWQ